MNQHVHLAHPVAFDFRYHTVGQSVLIHADCFEWLSKIPDSSIDAVVTDPPYGVKEYELKEIERMRSGGGAGIWRLLPVLDGVTRAPLPRFTDLKPKDRDALQRCPSSEHLAQIGA